MSTEDRAKAVGKNIEGKLQEVWGNLTGSKKDQAEGKAKQAEAAARHAVEDVKDAAKNLADKAKQTIDKL
ncbi:MAG: CsbD family protein [Actinomycetota bacterium]